MRTQKICGAPKQGKAHQIKATIVKTRKD